jgi:hypothetical protein
MRQHQLSADFGFEAAFVLEGHGEFLCARFYGGSGGGEAGQDDRQ